MTSQAPPSSRIVASEVRTGDEYEPLRDQARQQLAALRESRRVSLGDGLTLLFENRSTLLGVLEEQLRAERVGDVPRIEEEVGRCNRLLGSAGTLTALLVLEAPDPAAQAGLIADLRAAAATVSLRWGNQVVPATVLDGDDPIPVIRFAVGNALVGALPLGGGEVHVGVAHPRWRAEAVLSDRQRAALAADLGG